jgi:hypothetical protein
MTIDIVIVVLFHVLWRVSLSSFYIQLGRGYKESPSIGYNHSLSMTLSLIFLNYSTRFDLISIQLYL